jgi:hypothetical protein
MENFFAFFLFLGLPLFGWWLIRTTRSIGYLATTINESNIDLGELRIGGKSRGWLLLADLRFVLFLVLKKYRHLNLPTVVEHALTKARKDYLTIVGVFTTITLVGFGSLLFNGT